MTVSFSGRVAAVVGGVLVQSVALASMGNIGTTYGVLPSDIASAQALSLFNDQVRDVLQPGGAGQGSPW